MFIMKNIFVVIFCLILFVSCAPTMVITLDGRPVPSYAYGLSNPETGIEIQVVAARWSYINEGNEKILWPEYLSVDEVYKIDPDTTVFIEFDIKIKNLNKAYYKLVMSNSSETLVSIGEKKDIINGIYEGHLRHNLFKVRHFVKNNTLNKNIVAVVNEEGMTIMKVGVFSYKVIRSDSDFEERGDADSRL